MSLGRVIDYIKDKVNDEVDVNTPLTPEQQADRLFYEVHKRNIRTVETDVLASSIHSEEVRYAMLRLILERDGKRQLLHTLNSRYVPPIYEKIIPVIVPKGALSGEWDKSIGLLKNHVSDLMQKYTLHDINNIKLFVDLDKPYIGTKKALDLSSYYAGSYFNYHQWQRSFHMGSGSRTHKMKHFKGDKKKLAMWFYDNHAKISYDFYSDLNLQDFGGEDIVMNIANCYSTDTPTNKIINRGLIGAIMRQAASQKRRTAKEPFVKMTKDETEMLCLLLLKVNQNAAYDLQEIIGTNIISSIKKL